MTMQSAFSMRSSGSNRLAAAARRPAAAATGRAPSLRCAAAAAAPPKKGFASAKSGPLKDGCPCGSNKYYKDCCKQYHQGDSVPDLRATLRARFSAVVKKDLEYLMSTFDPEFTSHYFSDTAPGDNWDKLRDEMKRTVDHYEYTNFRILKVSDGDRPGEAYAQLQYSLLDKRTPALDDKGNKVRRVTIENGRFVQDAGSGRWRLADFRLVDVPGSLVRAAELESKDLKKQAADKKQAAAAAAGEAGAAQ